MIAQVSICAVAMHGADPKFGGLKNYLLLSASLK